MMDAQSLPTKPRSLQTLILAFFLLRLFEILKPDYGVVSAPECAPDARCLQVSLPLKNLAQEVPARRVLLFPLLH
jgi:hypothetical protein